MVLLRFFSKTETKINQNCYLLVDKIILDFHLGCCFGYCWKNVHPVAMVSRVFICAHHLRKGL